MNKTGVFAEKKEIEKAFELAKIASSTPVISFSLGDMLEGNDFSSRAWKSAHEYCHELALKKGLPEIQGFYGMTQEGEFVSV